MVIDDARRQSLSTMLRRSAARFGDMTAITCGDVEWSYAQLDVLVDRLCTGLLREGIRKGDRIAVLARNSHAFVALRFAVARAGAILVPINFMLIPEEVRFILEHSGARFLFLDPTTADHQLWPLPSSVEKVYGIAGEMASAPETETIANWTNLFVDNVRSPEVAAKSDIAQITYTSGTESRPKGAMLSHGALLWEYQSCIIDCEWTRDTVVLHSLPLFHCAQLDAMMGPALTVGARNIITSVPRAENIIPLLERHEVNSFFAPPTIWIAILQSPCSIGTISQGSPRAIMAHRSCPWKSCANCMKDCPTFACGTSTDRRRSRRGAKTYPPVRSRS